MTPISDFNHFYEFFVSLIETGNRIFRAKNLESIDAQYNYL